MTWLGGIQTANMVSVDRNSNLRDSKGLLAESNASEKGWHVPRTSSRDIGAKLLKSNHQLHLWGDIIAI